MESPRTGPCGSLGCVCGMHSLCCCVVAIPILEASHLHRLSLPAVGVFGFWAEYALV